jgi:hypothetical protein
MTLAHLVAETCTVSSVHRGSGDDGGGRARMLIWHSQACSTLKFALCSSANIRERLSPVVVGSGQRLSGAFNTKDGTLSFLDAIRHTAVVDVGASGALLTSAATIGSRHSQGEV